MPVAVARIDVPSTPSTWRNGSPSSSSSESNAGSYVDDPIAIICIELPALRWLRLGPDVESAPDSASRIRHRARAGYRPIGFVVAREHVGWSPARITSMHEAVVRRRILGAGERVAS